MLIDGSLHCVKNAKRLSEDARSLYESERYSSCLSLAVLALEEVGKSRMLLDAAVKKQDVTSSDWFKKFSSHREKLKFLISSLRTDSDDESYKNSFDKIANLMKMLLEKKMESLYVDWSSTQGEWRYFDEHESDKQKIAEDALTACKVFIDALLDNLGDNGLKIPDEIVELFLNGKVYGFCEECALCMITAADVRIHSIRTVHSKISWLSVSEKS